MSFRDDFLPKNGYNLMKRSLQEFTCLKDDEKCQGGKKGTLFLEKKLPVPKILFGTFHPSQEVIFGCITEVANIENSCT